MISPSLKLDVTVHLYRDVLSSNAVLGNQPELVEFIIHKLETNLRKPEFILIRRGDVADKLYFVARGEVSIHTLDAHFVEN